MTALAVLLACWLLALVVLIAVNVWDSPSVRARAAVEARGFVPRPVRRRVPRTATFIVQPRHVIDGQPGVVRRATEVEETVIVFDSGLLAGSEGVA